MKSRKGPGISSLKNRIPPIVGNNNSSVSGAGFNSNQPYKGPAAGGLNTNVFNIPKYGSGGIGGGIGGGSYGGLGGGIRGIGGGIGMKNDEGKDNEETSLGGRYKF